MARVTAQAQAWDQEKALMALADAHYFIPCSGYLGGSENESLQCETCANYLDSVQDFHCDDCLGIG